MLTQTTSLGHIANSFPSTLPLFDSNEVANVWFYILVSHSTDNKKQIILQAHDSFQGQLLSLDLKDDWEFDDTFAVRLGGAPNTSLFFNGKISQVEFIADFYSEDLATLTELRYSTPSWLKRA